MTPKRFKVREHKDLTYVLDENIVGRGKRKAVGEFESRAKAELLAAFLNLCPWLMDGTVILGWANEGATKTGNEAMAHDKFVWKDGKFRRIMEFSNVSGESVITTNLVSEHWSTFIANKVAPEETITVEVALDVELKQALSEVT